ncbi:MAG: hypothetical protein QG622_1304 [Actinomycetota bacterium]|nr:hypothetical protein [Actinomycetota bacterium]
MTSSAGPRTEPGTESEQSAVGEVPDTPPRRSWSRSARDLVLSLLVIIGMVAVIVALVPFPNSVPRQAVDVAAAARGSTGRLGFAPAVPGSLPSGWTATNVGVRRSADGITTWHIGYLTPDGHYASIEQAAEVTPRWLEIMDSGAVPVGTETVDGTTWERRYKDVRDVVALLHRGKDRTTLVTSKNGGTANAVTLARGIPVISR